MVYRFVQGLMWVTFKIFFKRIDLVGREKLQQNHPVILIANHPGSFLDAMVLAVFLKRPIYFYVRGDIFKHPLVYRIFTALHMIPIFNREDGTTNLARNQQTFDRGRSLLSKGNLLLVFPEGFSRLSKKLSPFKKGTARVALQAAFDEPAAIGLSIQAVAVNYSAHRLGANLFIRVGDRLDLVRDLTVEVGSDRPPAKHHLGPEQLSAMDPKSPALGPTPRPGRRRNH